MFRLYWDPSQQHFMPKRKATLLRKIEQDIAGFGLKDYALTNASGVLVSSLGTGISRPDSGLTIWQPLPVYPMLTLPEDKPALTDTVMGNESDKACCPLFWC